MNIAPTTSSTLDFSIGGYFGPSHTLRLRRGALHYSCADSSGAPPVEARQLTPSAAAWEEFWQEVERAGVWSWQAEYPDPGVCDGTQWSLKLRHGGRRIRSGGSNAYPGGDGPEYSPESSFAQFLRALERLTGVADLS